MVSTVFLFLGILGIVAGLSLAVLSQGYWFSRAWRFAGRIQKRSVRRGIHAALLVVLAGVAIFALVAVVRDMRGVISPGSWWTAFFGFWLSSSIPSYLLTKLHQCRRLVVATPALG